MTARGSVIGDSLRPGADLRPVDWEITRIWRLDVSRSAGPGQPPVWTVFDVEVDDANIDAVAHALARALKAEGGWYADLRSEDEHIVIFSDRVFRYHRGDREARAEAAEYGESVGVPSHQLDWPD